MPDDLAASLAAIAGVEHVLTDRDILPSYETDWTRRYSGHARLVVRPAETDGLSVVLAACHALGAPVVPQGGNTGLVGGGVPRGGEVVISTRRMRAIEDFDDLGQEVTAGAGVTLAELQAFAGTHGLRFGVDLASRDSATLGGMVATNAGGSRVMRFGPMRNQVIGLEAVLADGTVVTRLPGLAKDTTGYDLPGLLTGSEGTLAVITRIRVRLLPQLAARATALVGVADASAAIRIANAVRARVSSLEAAEIFFRAGLDLVLRHTGMARPFAAEYPAYLLLESVAAEDPAPALAEALASCTGILDSALGLDPAGRQRLWAYRERHTESINAEGIPHKLDVALPLRELTTFAERVPSAVHEAAQEARVILFGHIADGNLHVNILGLALDDDRATDAVLRLAASLGGSISAEHGVGVAKTRWLHLTRSPADIAAMRAIKGALDPSSILNPGVLFPPS